MPNSGITPLIVTRLLSINLSASLREQKPESLMNLFKRMLEEVVFEVFNLFHYMLVNAIRFAQAG